MLYTRVAGKDGQYDLGVTVGAVALIAIVVLRQVLTILENRRLYATLDAAYTVQGVALVQREQQMRTVVANAPIILCAVDAAGVCTLFEGQALPSLGHAAGQYVGQSLFDVWGAQPRIVDAMRRALAGESCTTVDTTAALVYETTWTPVRDATGAIDGAIGVSHDITQRTRAEQALQHQAFHDALTGLPNRALFLDRAGPCPDARAPPRGRRRRPVPRPRSLQAGQRQPRPCRRRPAPGHRGRAAQGVPARRGYRGALWRRRVCHPDGGPGRAERGAAAGRAHHRGARRARSTSTATTS